MGARADTDDYRALFLADVPLLDTRAPAEFERGAFPTARNLPLMTDNERAAVGTCYKQRGQAAAIALGHELVAGEVRERRLAAWAAFARAHAGSCARAGMAPAQFAAQARPVLEQCYQHEQAVAGLFAEHQIHGSVPLLFGDI